MSERINELKRAFIDLATNMDARIIAVLEEPTLDEESKSYVVRELRDIKAEIDALENICIKRGRY